jgi:integrase
MIETTCKPTSRKQKKIVPFRKALDGRKQPVRGLWIRNERFYARLSVEDPASGQKSVRRVPLEGVMTVAGAKEKLEELKLARRQSAMPVVTRVPKFGEFADEYLLSKQGKKDSTIAKEDGQLAKWKAHLGEVRLNKITKKMVREFMSKREAEGMSGRTINLDLITFRQVLKRALELDYIRHLPTSGLKALKHVTPKRSLVPLTEIESLCIAAQAVSKNGLQFSDYVRFMACTGARRNEALRVRWQDVDFTREQVVIGADGMTKNGESRIVDFNTKLSMLLADMHSRRAPDSQWLFPSPQRGDKDIPAKSFMETLKLARDEAKLPKFGFHDCRHYFISHAVMAGIDYMTIAKWVGHKDGGILIGKVYGHLANDHAKNQASKITFDAV